jgi:hypothetical protein
MDLSIQFRAVLTFRRRGDDTESNKARCTLQREQLPTLEMGSIPRGLAPWMERVNLSLPRWCAHAEIIPHHQRDFERSQASKHIK